MPSDRRFHPLTVLFALGGELRNFLAPILFASFTARSRGGDFENWFLIFMIPSVLIAGARYWFSTYRYADTELIVRTGIVFKNERHIPYARIQSVDARQNVVHRLFGVVDVRVQTGTGGEAEATLSVLPLDGLTEMRERVFAGRARASAATTSDAVDAGITADAVSPAPAPATTLAAPGEVILTLTTKDAVLSGLFENRGWVVIGAATGLAHEAGLFERLEWLPESSWMMWVAVAAGLFVISPLLSAVWAVVRLYGFTLTRRGEELIAEYGALTRITATIPLRRVQAVTIVRGWGHRLSGRAAIRVDTAGGGATAQAGGASQREWIAPILLHADVPRLVSLLLPKVSMDTIDWQPVDPRAVDRQTRVSIVMSLVIGAIALIWFEWQWVLPATVGLAGLLTFTSRKSVRSLRWYEHEQYVAYRSGWLSQVTTIVPVPKIQAVGLEASWFDRRWAMASVAVDTAGAGSHPVDVPYLPVEVADRLRMSIASRAAATEYRW